MTQDDLTKVSDSTGGPFPLADLYAALQPSLPDGYSVDQFAAAYADAYAEAPDSLAAQIMRGQHITPTAGLLRVQMWLLLIDGFVLPEQATGRTGSEFAARVVLAAGSRLGAAARRQPQSRSPVPGISARDWTRFLARLPLLAYDVPFRIHIPGPVHEGHGQPGPLVHVSATISSPRDFHVGTLLVSGSASYDIEIKWSSLKPSVLTDHGQLPAEFGSSITTNDGISTIDYQVKQEAATTRTYLVSELGDFVAWTDSAELLRKAYVWPSDPHIGQAISRLARSNRPADGGVFLIGWHNDRLGWQVEIQWTDSYGGIEDEITFDGFVTADSTVGEIVQMSGTGTATGKRGGWKACNPGIPEVPHGSDNAFFFGSATPTEFNVSAYAATDNPLSGIVTDNFKFTHPENPNHRSALYGPTKTEGQLCPHYAFADAFIRPLP
jgi:hypothetical protein